MVEVVLITSAPGQQAAHLIPHLYDNPKYHLRLVVNSENSLKTLQERYPRSETVQADLCNPKAVTDLVRGVTIIYHIGPSFHVHEAEMGYNMIDAAVAESNRPNSSFKLFLYSSVLNSQLSKMLNHGRKNLVEGYLMETSPPLPYTILQPGHFMDLHISMLVSQHASSTSTPTSADNGDNGKIQFKALYNTANKFSFMSLSDHADISARIIADPTPHLYAQYPLCSTPPISYDEFIDTMRKVLGREVEVERLEYAEAVDMMCTAVFKMDGEDLRKGMGGMGQKFKDGPERMLLFYDTHENALVGNTSVCEMLLGRKARGVEDVARTMMEGKK